MMASMASSCSSSVSSPALAAIFFWSRIAGFFGGMLSKLNPLNAVKGVGKGIKKGFKKVGRGFKKAGRGIGRSAKKTGRVFKKAFKIKKFRCFSPETPVKLENGKMVMMKNLKLGDILVNGSVVDAVMKIKNENDPYYKLNTILVTGSHYVKQGAKYIQVKKVPNAKRTNIVDPVVSCLVTSDHKIPVGDMIFWDWEDNLIPTKNNLDAVFNKIKSERRKINVSV
tara:strand:- start:456 stop:1130 length:675 start_codon:yes stop_codon:yes gene_type:complete